MSHMNDLRDLLEAWPYDEEGNVRMTRGDDGREILQVRTPMGIEQYELEERPDGQRPLGCKSLLEYQRQRLEEARAVGGEDEFALDEDDCAGLFQEGTLYYFRYLHLFQLRAWERVIRDTERNMGLFDFVHRHAEREEDRQHLEKWRPYILRMHAIARAMFAAEQQRLEESLAVLEDTVRRIEALEPIDDETFQFERNRSVAALRELLTQFRKTRPVSELERLEGELRQAIETQAFERAAQLRDRIREIRDRA
jgi:hypothetical protein